MNIKTITGNNDFIEFLRGKKATFLLALSNTNTANIEGITQAGIPGLIYLTPTLDSEFVCTSEVRSLENIAETPKGVPTPALITRAVHQTTPFSNIELLDLGLMKKPQIDYFKIHHFDIHPSDSIDTDANIDALELFEKGLEFGKNYKTSDDYIILAESVPSGTTTANAVALALGYKCEGMFSSSFKNNPKNIKDETIKKALEQIDDGMDIFTKLSLISDNMLIFNAGFILGLSSTNTKLVLAGGTQMAAVLLVVNSIVEHMQGVFDAKNISLCTTRWVYEDKNSDIKSLIELCNFDINTYYTDFNFSETSHPALKMYDDGEAKEGVGAGGAIMYSILNGSNKLTLTKEIEKFLN